VRCWLPWDGSTRYLVPWVSSVRFSPGRQSTREPARPVCARGTVRVLLLVTRTVGFGPVACVDGLTNRAATKSYENGFCTRPAVVRVVGIVVP
jgi:hypothetical protein